MPKRVNSFVSMSSFVPLVPALLFVFVALTFMTTVMASITSAQADTPCITQPTQPAPEGERWYLRYDRTKGRKCWVLAEASTNMRDVAAPQAQQSAAPNPSFSSQLTSLFESLTGSSANVSPQGNAPQGNLTSAPRKTQNNSASATRPEHGIRADQKDLVEGHAGKRVGARPLTQLERNALFEDFVRWRESQQNGQLSPSPTSP